MSDKTKTTIFLTAWIEEETKKAYKFLINGETKLVWLPKSMVISMHTEADNSCSIETSGKLSPRT